MPTKQRLKINTGLLIAFLPPAIASCLWIFGPHPEPPFSSIGAAAASLGELFGLLGITMFSFNLILATRLPLVEKLFGGLNRVYRQHSLSGQLGFIFLLFHPLLLLPRYAGNKTDAARFLFLSHVWARNWGIIALAMMITLIISTLYLRPQYETWKKIHRFFGVALFLAALHVYLIPAKVMQNPLLRDYILGMIILGIAAFLYKSVFGRFLVRRYEYGVEKLVKAGDDVVEISLLPSGPRLEFEAGQFVFISFKQPGFPHESHPFSISSCPGERYLTLTIKKSGDFTHRLIEELRVGAGAEIEGPFGVFSYKNARHKNQIWIAGGIGITPFISMARNLMTNKEDYHVKLFYCVREEQDAVYLDLLRRIERTPGIDIQVIPFYSGVKGRFNFKHAAKYLDNPDNQDILICAPPQMIKSLRSEFILGQTPRGNIHSEEFEF